MSVENTAEKKEPRAHNRYTGKRAQRIAWVRDYLYARLDDKAQRGHVLNREILTACKWLLIIEGVPTDSASARMDRQLKKPAKQVIKIPQLLKKLH